MTCYVIATLMKQNEQRVSLDDKISRSIWRDQYPTLRFPPTKAPKSSQTALPGRNSVVKHMGVDLIFNIQIMPSPYPHM